MNLHYSLHKIESKEHCPFDQAAYSWFKFGDRSYANQFAQELFDGFIQQYGDVLLAEQEIVILPSPYLAIPTASNFLCFAFMKKINQFLYEHGKKAATESKIYRNQTYVEDYGNLNFEDRVKLISNDTYYIDRTFINDKLCIFVDDIKITGSHEHTVNKILEQYQVKGKFIFCYYSELVNKDIHPNIENHYNYFAVKGVQEIVDVVNREHFQYNTRIVKFILKLNQTDFTYFINNIANNRKIDLFDLAISNNYHQIIEYKENINTIKLN